MTTADLSPAAAKAAFREQIRAIRRARTDAVRAQAADAIAARALPHLAESAIVACYLSMPTEPGTAAVIDLLRKHEIRVLLPRVQDLSLDWIELGDDTTFVTSGLGVAEPVGESHPNALTDCDAIVLPALAISAEGARLGQGGGFYDRALEAIPTSADGGPIRIALVFDDEIFDAIPQEPHDSTVDLAITPERVLSF